MKYGFQLYLTRKKREKRETIDAERESRHLVRTSSRKTHTNLNPESGKKRELFVLKLLRSLIRSPGVNFGDFLFLVDLLCIVCDCFRLFSLLFRVPDVRRS